MTIYRHFHQLSRAPTWGEVPVSCTCAECFAHCVCWHTLLFASAFNPQIRVPEEYIGASVSLRKQCKSIKGTAGRKRMRILEERKCNEKKIDSKVKYLAGTAATGPAKLTVPEAILPSESSNDDDFEVS